VTDPYVYAGFQRPPSRELLQAWIEGQDIDSIEDCFDKIPVKPGDVLLIPGGRPHALGEGILLLEIMEPSDLAVRFEFERCGYTIPEEARFMGQDIYTALDVFNLDPVPMDSVEQEFRCQPSLIAEDDGNKLEQLIGPNDTSCFTVRRATVASRFIREEQAFFIGIVIEGEGSFRAGDDVVKLKQWDRFFCPANLTFFGYESNKGMTVIECYSGGEGVAQKITKQSEAR
jgi:mannose-6-phosphate isomerase